MTVKDLIERLQALVAVDVRNADRTVYTEGCDCFAEAEGVEPWHSGVLVTRD